MRQITEVDCIAISLFPAESGAGRVQEKQEQAARWREHLYFSRGRPA